MHSINATHYFSVLLLLWLYVSLKLHRHHFKYSLSRCTKLLVALSIFIWATKHGSITLMRTTCVPQNVM